MATNHLPALTLANYYSQEADVYLSNSQRKAWVSCPRAAYARYIEADDTAIPPQKAVFAEGGALDAMLLDPDDLKRVEKESAVFLFTSAGKPTAAYKRVQSVARYVRKQAWVMDIIDRCSKQDIFTFEIEGVPYKARTDMVDHENRVIYDMKHMASLTKREWMEVGGRNQKVHWIIAWDYLTQLAIYQEALLQETGEEYYVALLGISKPTNEAPTPDIRVIYWDEENIAQVFAQMPKVETQTLLIDEWRDRSDPSGLRRCEDCEYCRLTRGPWFERFSEEIDL